MQGRGKSLAPVERDLLLQLQRDALKYFLDNQTPRGLIRDRQSNHGPVRQHGLCSTATTGMGFIALALASAPPYSLLSPQTARERIRAGVRTVLDQLPHNEGVLPHFVDARSGAVYGWDRFSTVDSSWLFAGALWAAEFLQDPELEQLAQQLYERVDWLYWSTPHAAHSKQLLRHGKGHDGAFLTCAWDRLNGETAFMYVLAAGAAEGRRIPARTWNDLRPFYGTLAGRHFNNADLGLFVFQYGLDLLDLTCWQAPGPVELFAEARLAAEANREVCRAEAGRFTTYRRFWGLSAGDGPGEGGERDTYRIYAPTGPVDGTAHVMATLASIVHCPEAVLENIQEARRDSRLQAQGRYGLSNINLDRGWVGRDMVGIDAGAAVLALDNFLMAGRVREVFHRVPCVQRGLEHLGFCSRNELLRQAS
jgi:hypothetical protein